MFPDNPKAAQLKLKISNIIVGKGNSCQTIPETPAMQKIFVSPVGSQPPWPTQVYGDIDRQVEEISAAESRASKESITNDYAPTFSLGLTPLQPRNICAELNFESVPRENKETKLQNRCKRAPSRGTEIIDYKDNEEYMQKRPKRVIQPTDVLRSPFLTRIVDLTARKIKKEEEEIWQWLFQYDTKEENAILFAWVDKLCTKSDFKTLKLNEWVLGSVIDCWTWLLNDNEKLKATSSPLRLFFTLETTLVPLGNNKKTNNERFEIFTDHIDIVMCTVKVLHAKHYEPGEFDMFFFPIFTGAHYYLVSYNIKQPSWDIIDNIAGCTDVRKTYGEMPFYLHKLFLAWMKIESISAWKEMVKLKKPVPLQMHWQTRDNSDDCGIFVMRHMETYMGTHVNQWTTGLHTESVLQKRQLEKLRIIYCHHMLTSPLNERREENLDDVRKFKKEHKSEKKKVMQEGRWRTP